MKWWIWKGQPLCVAERFSSDGRTEAYCPVLYNGEFAYLLLVMEKDKGYARGYIPDGETSRVGELKAGDDIVPLYPLDSFGTEALAPVSEDILWDEKYLMGNRASLGDAGMDIARQSLVNRELALGFMVLDKARNQYFTEFISY